MIKIIANGFGVLSTICFIISFQVKSNKGLFIIQSIANVFYGLQFFLLGATGGLFNMFMQIVRNMLLLKINDWKWLQWKGCAPIFCIPSLIYMIIEWGGPLDLFRSRMAASQLSRTSASWSAYRRRGSSMISSQAPTAASSLNL